MHDKHALVHQVGIGSPFDIVAAALLSYLVRIQAERLIFANRMSLAFRY